MHKLKFLQVTHIEPWDRLTRRSYQFLSCADAARTYESNIARTHALTSIPGYSFLSGERWMQAFIIARDELPDLDQNSVEFANATREAFYQLADTPSAFERVQHYQEATLNAESICSFIPPVYEGFEALLQSMIIQAWTAFETLVKQLLKRSVKNHAECFPHLNGTEKFGFQKRDVFRRAYAHAFRDHTRILNLLEDQSVDALGELRNLLVHNAGIVDVEFHEACIKMHSPAWAALAIDRPYPITGVAVRSLVDSNVKCAYALIAAVDDWLTANKPS